MGKMKTKTRKKRKREKTLTRILLLRCCNKISFDLYFESFLLFSLILPLTPLFDTISMENQPPTAIERSERSEDANLISQGLYNQPNEEITIDSTNEGAAHKINNVLYESHVPH